MSECRFGSGSVIEEADLPRLLSEDCIIEPGAVIRLFYHDEVTADAFGSGIVANIPRKVPKMEEEASGLQQLEPAVPDEVQPTLEAKPPVKTVASVGQADAPVDLSAIASAAGGNSTLTVILALIAVLFGAAGWKFWQKVSADHHEFRMRELELKADAAKGQSQQHQQCATVHAQHEARLAALESKVTSVEQSAMSLDTDFDPADLKKRITKVEKALKAKPK